MTLKVFAVFDSAAELYLPPMFFRSVGEAIRAFSAAVNQQDHQFNLHAQDYTLFSIGEYSEDKGKMMPYEANHSLGNAVEFRKARPVMEDQLQFIGEAHN